MIAAGTARLISIGAAPNVAARLSDLREAPYRSFTGFSSDLTPAGALNGLELRQARPAGRPQGRKLHLTVHRLGPLADDVLAQRSRP